MALSQLVDKVSAVKDLIPMFVALRILLVSSDSDLRSTFSSTVQEAPEYHWRHITHLLKLTLRVGWLYMVANRILTRRQSIRSSDENPQWKQKEKSRPYVRSRISTAFNSASGESSSSKLTVGIRFSSARGISESCVSSKPPAILRGAQQSTTLSDEEPTSDACPLEST